MILHIAARAEWAAARAAGEYRAPSLEAEGFLHCSTGAQILGPAGRYYRGRDDLLLLCIDPAKLAARLVYEDTAGRGEDYPHIYGPLNLDAVFAVVEFPCGPDGGFSLPPLPDPPAAGDP